MPGRAGAHGTGPDLTDPAWLDAIPTDRPAVIVADGLMAFLTQEDLIAAGSAHRPLPRRGGGLQRLFEIAIRAAKHYHGTQSVAGLIRSPGFDDPMSPNAGPQPALVREILLTREPEVAEFPPALRRFTAWPPTAPRCPGEAAPSCTTASSRGVDHAMARVEVGSDA